MMERKEHHRIKQYGIWLMLLAKRLWRQPAYIALLVLIPVIGAAVGVLEREAPKGAVAAVCVEESAWSGQIVEALNGMAEEGILKFSLCGDAAEVERQVVTAEADCGFVIGTDINERVMDRAWRKAITVYEASAGSVTDIAKEQVASVIFRLYSEQCYEEYMRNAAGKAVSDENSDQESQQKKTEEIVIYAKAAYEKHLTDGSTFDVKFVGDNRLGQYENDTDVGNDTYVFPLKGVFAVVIFISGMCGMLEYDRDRREKRFERIAPNILTYMVDVWMPTVFVSLAVLICLWLSDGIRGGISAPGGFVSVWDGGVWAAQIWRLLCYQGIIVLYCCVLSVLLRRQETIASAIPILSAASLVCAPVFIRLSAFVPIFKVLEKLFPVTYYLML